MCIRDRIFSECPDITAVIQFAAYKAVGESVSKPIEYYYNKDVYKRQALAKTRVFHHLFRHRGVHRRGLFGGGHGDLCRVVQTQGQLIACLLYTSSPTMWPVRWYRL